MTLKIFVLSLACFLVLDLIWIGGLASRFYIEQLSQIGRITEGKFNIVYWPAIIVYLLLGAGISLYVMPQISPELPLWRAFLIGAGMGLIVYGVYDMTNLATLKAWTVKLAIVDMLWGSLLCGITTLAAKTYRDWGL